MLRRPIVIFLTNINFSFTKVKCVPIYLFHFCFFSSFSLSIPLFFGSCVYSFFFYPFPLFHFFLVQYATFKHTLTRWTERCYNHLVCGGTAKVPSVPIMAADSPWWWWTAWHTTLTPRDSHRMKQGRRKPTLRFGAKNRPDIEFGIFGTWIPRWPLPLVFHGHAAGRQGFVRMLAPDLYSSSIPPLFPLYPSFPPPQEDVPMCVWCARVGGVKWRQSPSQRTVLSQRLEYVLLSSPPLEVKTTVFHFNKKPCVSECLDTWGWGGCREHGHGGRRERNDQFGQKSCTVIWRENDWRTTTL